MKKSGVCFVIGILALCGAVFFVYGAISTGNLYTLGWMILFISIALAFITPPKFIEYVSRYFLWFQLPASIIGVVIGIFVTGKAGSYILGISMAGIGSMIVGEMLLVFIGMHSGAIKLEKSDVEYDREKAAELIREPLDSNKPSAGDKPASVVGRAVAGGIIAGGVGAVVGALSAVDKNNRVNKDKKD